MIYPCSLTFGMKPIICQWRLKSVIPTYRQFLTDNAFPYQKKIHPVSRGNHDIYTSYIIYDLTLKGEEPCVDHLYPSIPDHFSHTVVFLTFSMRAISRYTRKSVINRFSERLFLTSCPVSLPRMCQAGLFFGNVGVTCTLKFLSTSDDRTIAAVRSLTVVSGSSHSEIICKGL